MERYKYVGRGIPSDLKSIATGLPVDPQRFAEGERSVFRAFFREQVTEAVRTSGGAFRDGNYHSLSSQAGAFERLEELMNLHKFPLTQIIRVEGEKDEFLCKAQLRLPVLPGFTDKLFSKPLAEGNRPYVLVSFYFGVCHTFADIHKREDVEERAMNEFFSPEFVKTLKEGEEKSTIQRALLEFVKEVGIKDEAFNPDVVIPSIIKNLRLEVRFAYRKVLNEYHIQRFYQSPEGYIYGIIVDGYVAHPS